ncbi:DNA cytosine methyltransferase [Paraburkholderia sp. BR10872]|uniref:DNA cytosine methyltransferase n=1 Tax=Paraburkholderia sp. BR10872 TaxID=3236989 RepID=UPI0034D156EC
MRELHLFAGAGGGILAGQLRGNRCVCAVEREPYAQAVLVARQNDGTFPPFPIWDDVCDFDGRPWRGIVDIVAGGFPCQDISAAGTGEGLDGERSGLWTEMARIIREVQPKRVEVENSPMLTSRGLGRVLGDLAEMGFDAEWGVLSAADTGAPHLRERIWILAHANGMRELQQTGCECDERDGSSVSGEALADANGESGQQGRTSNATQGARGRDANRGGVVAYVADTMRERGQGVVAGGPDQEEREGQIKRPNRPRSYGFGRWPTEPGMGRVVDGMAHRSHRIKALGNGQVPRVAAAAFTLLSNG